VSDLPNALSNAMDDKKSESLFQWQSRRLFGEERRLICAGKQLE
jgi:hypothetical protein